MPIYVSLPMASILAIAATIIVYVVVMPANKRESLSPFLKWLHDFFHFKSLWLEKILKALYVFSTLYCICMGVLLLFSVQREWGETSWLGGYGLLVMILGPIAVRIAYESIMLFIILVRNSGEINNKLSAKEKEQNTPESNQTDEQTNTLGVNESEN